VKKKKKKIRLTIKVDASLETDLTGRKLVKLAKENMNLYAGKDIWYASPWALSDTGLSDTGLSGLPIRWGAFDVDVQELS
jgi:hypothetical protein